MSDSMEIQGMLKLVRPLAGALIQHRQLPVGIFGPPLIEIPEDTNYINYDGQIRVRLPPDEESVR